MPNRDNIILVVDRSEHDAADLQRLIQFMDSPNVAVVSPEKWKSEIGARRVEAVFVGTELDDKEIHAVVREVGELDPNIPVVLLSEES